MIKKAIVLGWLAVSLAACFGTGQSKRYFDLQVLKTVSPRLGPGFDKVLLIDRVDVLDLYNDFRILYRLSNTEVNYYPYDFWAAKPDKILQDAIRHFMTERGSFRRVDVEMGKADPDWVLRARVFCLEEIDESDSWSARLAMSFEINDFKTGRVLSSWSFDRSLPLSRKSVTDLPPALSRILTDELETFLHRLREAALDRCP